MYLNDKIEGLQTWTLLGIDTIYTWVNTTGRETYLSY